MGDFKTGFKEMLIRLGKNNDAVYAVLAIAVFKGVFRPIFTMADKSTPKEDRKYAACREGLTEAIAFISYIASSLGIKASAKPLCKAHFIYDVCSESKTDKKTVGAEISKILDSSLEKLPKENRALHNLNFQELLETIKTKINNPDVAKAANNHIEVLKNFHNLEKSLSFIGVCLSAGLLIPLICNLSMKPIMKFLNFQKPQDKTDGGKPQISEKSGLLSTPKIKRPAAYTITSGGMRV